MRKEDIPDLIEIYSPPNSKLGKAVVYTLNSAFWVLGGAFVSSLVSSVYWHLSQDFYPPPEMPFPTTAAIYGAGAGGLVSLIGNLGARKPVYLSKEQFLREYNKIDYDAMFTNGDRPSLEEYYRQRTHQH